MNCLVITGASAGIGKHTAARFVAEGYSVVNMSRRPCPIDGVRQLTCDLAEPGFLDGIATELAEATADAEQIVLIHNAARMNNDTARDTADDAFRATLEINLVAPNALNAYLVPRMPPGSAVLYVGSTLAEKAVPGSFSYVVSKHAMIGMMRATCQDLAGSGIHTACICPGFTDTEMLRAHVPAEFMDSVKAMSAYNRLIDPDEIADCLYWCASAPVINGSVLHANLGQIES